MLNEIQTEAYLCSYTHSYVETLSMTFYPIYISSCQLPLEIAVLLLRIHGGNWFHLVKQQERSSSITASNIEELNLALLDNTTSAAAVSTYCTEERLTS